jgi:pyrroloquinoline quinone (PQQ) biosynthesis protein C
MMMDAAEFRERLLGVVGEAWFEQPCALHDFLANYLTPESVKVYAMEHCVFAASFPRWLANVAGNCPHLDVRQYLIENMYVEEVRDPTEPIGHYESMVRFAVAVGLDDAWVRAYQGYLITRLTTSYWDHASRTRPWLEAFAAAAGLEIKANRTLLKRYGREPQSAQYRKRFKTLGLPDSALIHFHQAEAADPVEGGHGEMPVNILVKYATTAEQQEAVLRSLRESIQVNHFHWDAIGKRAIEVARGAPVFATA